VETGLKALADVDTASLRPAKSMLILTVSGLNVLGPVLAQGPVSRLTG